MKVKKQKKVIKQFLAAALLSVAKEMSFSERFNFLFRRKLGKSFVNVITKQSKINYKNVMYEYNKYQRNSGADPQGV